MNDSRETERFLAEVEAHGAELRLRPLLAGERYPTPSGAALKAGTIVCCRMQTGEPVLEEVVAEAGSALAMMHRLAGRSDLSPLFPEAVELEAAECCANPGFDDPALLDLTELPFVTIDYQSSRDLDQAIYVCRSDEFQPGGHDIYYALADAAYYVKPGSALFAEALKRGASYYLPGLVVPMLPRSLSEGLISLNPGEPRRSLVFRISLDANGETLQTRLIRGRIFSRAKLTYDGVQRYLTDPASSPIDGQEYCESLRLMRHVGQLRIADSEARNVVRFHRVSLEVRLPSKDALTFDVVGESRNDVELYNEQVSLLCNSEGAALLEHNGEPELVQPIFRVHPAPDESALESLAHRIRELVSWRGLDPGEWNWRQRSETLAEYLKRLPKSGIQARLARAISRQAMLLNHPSRYSAEAQRHYGVGVPAYSRFTAPMREIVGIFTHKEALELLLGQPRRFTPQEDDQLRERVIAAGNGSRRLQTQLTKQANELVLNQLFAEEFSRPMEQRTRWLGTVLGLRQNKIYVQFDDPPVEVKIYTHDIWETAHVDPREIAVFDWPEGPICLGDPLYLTVETHEPRRRRWIFKLEKPTDL